MRKYGLIGYPLAHSFSKSYFTEKFQKEKIRDCSYDNFPISDLGMLPRLLADDRDLCGLNVTIPYKSEIFKFIDYLDPEAREIGAVNVLKIKRTGHKIQLYGFNSDITGIQDSLSTCIQQGIKNAVILGTGGSSHAVCHVLKKANIGYTQVSRNRKEGIISYSDLERTILENSGLIINTTPLGMYPDIDSRPDINYSQLNEKHTLFDLVYNPEITAFLRSGLERGCKIITGLKMLHSQAERAWQIWNDEIL
jgi:shikimate dehydrogenase